MTLSPTDAHDGGHRRHGTTEHAGDQAGTGPEAVVFVDSTGRRALLLRRAGIVFGAAVLVYAGLLGVAFMGGPSLAPSQLTPFDSVGTAQDPGGNSVQPAGSSPSARHTARQCRNHCGRKCRKHPAQCRKRLREKARERSGSSAGAGGAAPRPTASSSVGSR
ncbi:hypothetical protein [Streptomyces winkii]|uniref:hypothetical protein n=1 Tax=Streptomyces winkii TaxID=3051178 RepID=UPI0028D13EBA|nr:hypothetical protein [Streptomyces sp. DSM 40971]